MSHILEAVDLNTFYGRSHILFDVSLAIAQGETICLMGRNGAGKTTTFRSIMGLTPAKTGTVRFKGRDCTKLPPYKRARLGLGFVPEDRRILGPFSVKENLGLGRIPGRTGRWTLESVLEQFPVLSHMLDRLGGTLSGGEQQMLTIARALMSNPDVLVLDEPTEGLAPIIVEELLRALKRLVREEGLSAIVIEQHARKILELTDEAIVLERGRVVLAAGSAELLADPSRLERHLGLAAA